VVFTAVIDFGNVSDVQCRLFTEFFTELFFLIARSDG